jgi:hypothetical protein
MFADISLHVFPIGPIWLIAAVLLAILAAIVVGTVAMRRGHVAVKWVAALACLRVLACALFLLILLQPALAWTRSSAPLPELLILVDTSKSMAAPSAKHGTRLDEVRAALQGGDVGAALAERFRPHWFAFDRTAYRCDSGDLTSLTTTNAAADLSHSLQAAFAVLAAEDRPPQRMLLVSAGNDRGEGDAAQVARRLGLKADVLAPVAGTAPGAPAIRVAEVQAARRVLLGSETHFRVTVEADPPPVDETKLTLHLTEDGKELEKRPVVLKAGQADAVLVLAHRPTAGGTKTYSAALMAADGKPAGPRKDIVVQVVDSKYEVLVLEDRWRWEYKYLHRLFEDDPSFRFTALLPRSGGAFVQFASPDRRVNLVGFPQSGAELEAFDLFFVGDVQPKRWPRGLPEALARLVADEGKSLVVIAGPELGSLADIPALNALLPVDLTRESGTPISGAIEARPRVDAAASPLFFQLGKDAADLPPIDHVYPVLRKRPGATVLLEAAKERNDYGPLIVMAEHTVGRGRVLFIATDTLWKWHTLAVKDGPTPYTIFWQQALRALTPARSQLGPVQLWLTSSRSGVTAGQTLEITAEVQAVKPIAAARLQAVLSAPGGTRWPLAMSADPANPGRFRTNVTLDQAGVHRVQAVLSAEGKTLAEAAADVQVEEPADSTNGEIDAAFLRRIATATGGSWIDPANPATWPSADAEPSAALPQVRTFDLWGSFTLLLLLCAVLGIDWALRVMKGLV